MRGGDPAFLRKCLGRRRRKDARGMEQGLQLFRSIRQGRRTGFPHGLDLAVAPGDADGGDAVDLGPQNVKGGVPTITTWPGSPIWARR